MVELLKEGRSALVTSF
jgi:cation-transporting P-type ATPase 13A2